MQSLEHPDSYLVTKNYATHANEIKVRVRNRQSQTLIDSCWLLHCIKTRGLSVPFLQFAELEMM